MQACLLIDEILQVVADNFGPDDPKERQTLLHMSLTCRAFFEPGMNALWRTLFDAGHIVRALPSHTWGRHLDFNWVEIIRPPTEAEWQRVERYSQRVRQLLRDRRPSIPLKKRTPRVHWDFIVPYLPNKPLFPNLRIFHSDDYLQCPTLYLFINPPLRKLRLRLGYPSGFDHIATALSSCSLSLQELELSAPDGYDITAYEQSIELVSNAVVALKNLTWADCFALSPNAIRHLASLSTLQCLRFTLPAQDSDTDSLHFPTLKVLWVKSSAVAPFLVPTFLRRLVAPALRSVQITLTREMHHGNTEASLIGAIIAALPCLKRVVYVTLDGPPYDLPLQPNHILSASTLAPLLDMPLMQLSMPQIPIALASDDVAVLACAWPRMRALQLSDWMKGTRAVYLDVEDLVPFAQFMPELHTLGLPVRIPNTWTAAPATQEYVGRRLQKLYVADIHPEFAPDAVQFLASTFPNAAVSQAYGHRLLLAELNKTKASFAAVLATACQARQNGLLPPQPAMDS